MYDSIVRLNNISVYEATCSPIPNVNHHGLFFTFFLSRAQACTFWKSNSFFCVIFESFQLCTLFWCFLNRPCEARGYQQNVMAVHNLTTPSCRIICCETLECDVTSAHDFLLKVNKKVTARWDNSVAQNNNGNLLLHKILGSCPLNYERLGPLLTHFVIRSYLTNDKPDWSQAFPTALPKLLQTNQKSKTGLLSGLLFVSVSPEGPSGEQCLFTEQSYPP